MAHRMHEAGDALPARYVGGFQLQEIRQREAQRQASARWPLLSAVDEHLWARHLRRESFRRALDRALDVPEAAPSPRVVDPSDSPRPAAAGGHRWGTSR